MSVDEFIRTSGSTLRGDYAAARADFTVDQDMSVYTDADHELRQRLYARQFELVRGYAFEEYLGHLGDLDMSRSIPDFTTVSNRLQGATGWKIVAVPGLIPDLAFFNLLASRRFPTTVWLRKPEEFDYIVEPDIFRDCFGHMPCYSVSIMPITQAYGLGNRRLHDGRHWS